MSKATNPSFKEQLREHFSCNFVYPENLMNWEILNLNAMFNWFYASCYLLSYITILLTLIKKNRISSWIVRNQQSTEFIKDYSKINYTSLIRNENIDEKYVQEKTISYCW